MKIAFLVQGEETKSSFLNTPLPNDVKRKVGTYKAEGGDLYFIDFSIDGSTIANARALAALRDNLPTGKDVRLLRDEASAKFCELLYPHFCRFEKGLREAITIATCAEQGNFDDKNVIELEEQLSLEALYNMLFIDNRFNKEVRSLIKSGFFTKENLEDELDNIDETLLWDVLFSPEDMPTLRENRIAIKNRRNDVMHYHKVTEDIFDNTRALLKSVNNEIDQYLDRVRDDISYPMTKARDARIAAQIISESYADMIENMCASIDLSALAGLSDSIDAFTQIAAKSINSNAISSLQQLTENMGASNISGLSQQIANQQSNGLSANVAKAISSIQVDIPKIDLGISNIAKPILNSMQAYQNAVSAPFINTIREIQNNYSSLISREALNSLKFAASTSMDFSAGLSMGTAFGKSLGNGDQDNSEIGSTNQNNNDDTVK